MHSNKIHQGVGPSIDLRITVPLSDTFDPSTPTSVVWMAHRDNGTTVELSGRLIDQSADAVTVVHVWDADEPSTLGDWDVWAVFSYASGPDSRSGVYQFTVVPPYFPIT